MKWTKGLNESNEPNGSMNEMNDKAKESNESDESNELSGPDEWNKSKMNHESKIYQKRINKESKMNEK